MIEHHDTKKRDNKSAKKEDTKNRTKIGQKSRTKEIGHEQVGQKIRQRKSDKKIRQKDRT